MILLRFTFSLLLSFCLLALLPFAAKAVSYTWSTTPQNTNWDNPSNWISANMPNTGFPGSSDEALINACSVCPVLTGPIILDRLVVQNNGQIYIGGNTLTVARLYISTGKVHSNNGTLRAAKIEDIRYCHFSDERITIHISPNGTGIISGGNIYHQDVAYLWNNTIQPAGSAFYLGHSIVEDYRGEASFTNSGTGWLHVSYNTTSSFAKKVTFHTSTTGGIQVGSGTNGKGFYYGEVICNNTAYQGTIGIGNAQFYGPVTVLNGASSRQASFNNSTFRQAVTINHLNQNVSHHVNWGIIFSNSTFETTATLNTGTHGFIGGRLYLSNVKYLNTAPCLLSLGSSAFLLEIGQGTSFAGDVDLKAPHISLNGGTFAKTAIFEKTGLNNTTAGVSANNLGGNTFNGNTTLINSGGGLWYFGQNAPDIFNDALSVEHRGGNGTYLAHWNNGHQFNGNLTLTMASPSTGSIQFGVAGGNSVLAAGKLLTATFGAGELKLFNFTQRGEVEPLFHLSSSSQLTFGAGSLFEAPITLSAGGIYLNGATFLKPAHFTKTGTGDNNSTGGNSFKGKVTIINQASSGNIHSALVVEDKID